MSKIMDKDEILRSRQRALNVSFHRRWEPVCIISAQEMGKFSLLDYMIEDKKYKIVKINDYNQYLVKSYLKNMMKSKNKEEDNKEREEDLKVEIK